MHCVNGKRRQAKQKKINDEIKNKNKNAPRKEEEEDENNIN